MSMTHHKSRISLVLYSALYAFAGKLADDVFYYHQSSLF